MDLGESYMVLEWEFLRDCGQDLPKYLPKHCESFTVISTQFCTDDQIIWDGRYIYCSFKIQHELLTKHQEWRKMRNTPLWKILND